MATGGDLDHLTRKQIVRLAAAISADNMASIGEGYMDIDDATIKNKKFENKDSAEAFNRDIIKHWMYKNPDNQVQTLANLLYEAASDCSYVDAKKVSDILGVSRERSAGNLTSEESDDRELHELAEILRPYTARVMKIEVAPWIRDYVTEMEDLYCELILEKINKKMYGFRLKRLKNYREVFIYDDYRTLDPNQRVPGKKVLFKGDPGKGKTTLVKKIAWDWAKKFFTGVSIVFFVFLKFVKPADTIENVIIQQTPLLEGLDITQERLAKILKNGGNKCLLILDGLDEHAFGKNQDVLKILRGAKYLCCHVLLTSRPHSTRQIEGFFDTVVSVEGFTQNEATKFASRIVSDFGKIRSILRFNPSSGDPLYSVPILLSFLCLLVREDNIDLSDKTIRIGDIYTRMIRCLYKKYTIREEIDFKMGRFIEVVTSLGKLALKTLLSDNPLLQRSEVLSEVGQEAFDYGLLICHEDFRLIRDETADIYVTFPHRSVQEFLGAFYFIVMLNGGETIESLTGSSDQKSILLANPLFLQFCLCFMYSSDEAFSFLDEKKIQNVISGYIVQQIDGKDFNLIDLGKKFPFLDIRVAFRQKQQMVLNLMKDVLGRCRQITHIVMDTEHPVDWVLQSIRPVFKSLKLIQIGPTADSLAFKESLEHAITLRFENNYLNEEQVVNGDYLKLSLSWYSAWNSTSEHHLGLISEVLQHCSSSQRHLVMYVDIYGEERCAVDLGKILNRAVRGLYLSAHSEVEFQGDVPHCPSLTHLSFRKANDGNLLHALSRALQNNRLPKLSNLSLAFCQFFNIDGMLPLLFQKGCATLDHLNVCNVELDDKDIEFLNSVNIDTEWSPLPKLSSLVFSSRSFSGDAFEVWSLFQQPWNNLKSFTIHDDGSIGTEIVEILNSGKLPSLTELRFSVEREHHLDISMLDPEKMPCLETLSLNRFITSWTQLNVLAHKVRIWNLKKLVIYDSKDLTGNLSMLVSHSLPFLEELTLIDCGLNVSDLKSLAYSKARDKLPKLEHLDISKNGLHLSLKHLMRDPDDDSEVTWTTVKCDDS